MTYAFKDDFRRMMKTTYRYNPYKVILLTNKTELYGNRKRKKDLDELLSEIGRAQLISAEEELALIKAIQEKGAECDEMDKLIESNRAVRGQCGCSVSEPGTVT